MFPKIHNPAANDLSVFYSIPAYAAVICLRQNSLVPAGQRDTTEITAFNSRQTPSAPSALHCSSAERLHHLKQMAVIPQAIVTIYGH